MRNVKSGERNVLQVAAYVGLCASLLALFTRAADAELYLRVDHSSTAEYDVLVVDQDFGVASLRDNMRLAGGGLQTTSFSVPSTASLTPTNSDLYAQEGVIGFSGAVGDFQMNVTTGFSSPLLGPEARMDLFNVSFSGGSGTLTIELWDTGFETEGDDTRFHTLLGGTTDGIVEIATYADGDADAFGTEYLLASGIYDGSSTMDGIAFSSDQSTDISVEELVGSYAMGIRATITHSFGDVTSFDIDLQSASAVPEPTSALLALVLLLCGGFVRLPRRRTR